MLVSERANVLCMPRCGSTSATNGLAYCMHKLNDHLFHDGWSLLPAHRRARPTFALVREPLSWYASFLEYARGSIWHDYFGWSNEQECSFAHDLRRTVEPSEQWAQRARSIITGVSTPRNVLAEMYNAKIGAWSWWALHILALSERVVDAQQSLAPVRLLWLDETRDADLKALCSLHNTVLHPSRVYRNASKRATVEQLFNDELLALVHRYDGAVLRRLQAMPRGVV